MRSFDALFPRAAAGLLAIGLACGSAGIVRAQGMPAEPPPGAGQGGSFDGILRALDLKPRIVDPPAFVRDSRPAAPGPFIPVGRGHAERAVKVMSPAELQAATASLDDARVAQQRRAGVKPPPVPLKLPKDGAGAPKSAIR